MKVYHGIFTGIHSHSRSHIIFIEEKKANALQMMFNGDNETKGKLCCFNNLRFWWFANAKHVWNWRITNFGLVWIIYDYINIKYININLWYACKSLFRSMQNVYWGICISSEEKRFCLWFFILANIIYYLSTNFVIDCL